MKAKLTNRRVLELIAQLETLQDSFTDPASIGEWFDRLDENESKMIAIYQDIRNVQQEKIEKALKEDALKYESCLSDIPGFFDLEEN